MGALTWPFTMRAALSASLTNRVTYGAAPLALALGPVADDAPHADAEVALEADHVDGLDADATGHRTTEGTPWNDAA